MTVKVKVPLGKKEDLMKWMIIGLGLLAAMGVATAAEAFDRPCLASAAAPIWKEGDSVPCSVDLAGTERAGAGGGGGAGVGFPNPSGTAFFSVVRTDIAASSVNLAFGFTSKKVVVTAASANTDDVCVDWLGGTAVCPAANTAGDARLLPGQSILLDDYAVTSLSVISASGTQRVNVTAWN